MNSSAVSARQHRATRGADAGRLFVACACLLATSLLSASGGRAQQLDSPSPPDATNTSGAELHARQKLLDGKTLRVVCFGDSVTGVYYHTGSRRAYTDMLGIALQRAAPRAAVQMVNAGVSGHTTVNALARIDRDVLRHQPDLVTVMFGLNDMTRVPRDAYRANLREIVARCRAAGAEVILATPNNVIDTEARPIAKLRQYCDVVRDVGRELNVPVCDVYQRMEMLRARDPFAWRLLMSDAIHPNMDGHKRIASALAQTITGRQVPLGDVPPPQPALQKTLGLLRNNQPVRVLAMPPFDGLIEHALEKSFPEARTTVETWQVEGLSLREIEQDAERRVRGMQPDLVVIAVPRSAHKAKDDESFAGSYAWIMNWSLAFGRPTWDCIVVHPDVAAPQGEAEMHDELIRRLVHAQDLSLIDREAEDDKEARQLLTEWLKRQVGE